MIKLFENKIIYIIPVLITIITSILLAVFLEQKIINNILFFGFNASASTSNVFLDVSNIIRFGITFSAGLISVFNPCGFALLSIYLSVFIQRRDKQNDIQNYEKNLSSGLKITNHYLRKLFEATSISLTISVGFVIIFFVIGILLSAGFYTIRSFFSYIGIIISIFLVFIGFYSLYGGTFYTPIIERIANKISYKNQSSYIFYFSYGLSYGLTSLSCTLPIFMSIVFSISSLSEIHFLLTDFLLFGFGVWVALFIISISLIFVKILLQKVNYFLKIYKYVTSIFIILCGIYLILYWMTEIKF